MRRPFHIPVVLVLLAALSSVCVAQTTRYFKAEHGVSATYLKIEADGRYRVIYREHMGIFLRDEGRWRETGSVYVFKPNDTKRSPYEAAENKHKDKVFLAVTSEHAAAGIVISAEDIKKDLDANPRYLPDHVLFEISATVFNEETKQTYPFRHVRPK